METRHNVEANTSIMGINNIFADESLIKDYQPRWECLNERHFNDTEKAAIASCEVVPSQHGMSICFAMVNGHKRFIPLDSQSKANLGDKPSKDDVTIKIIQATQDINGANGLIPKGTKKVRADVVAPNMEPDPQSTFDNPLGL